MFWGRFGVTFLVLLKITSSVHLVYNNEWSFLPVLGIGLGSLLVRWYDWWRECSRFLVEYSRVRWRRRMAHRWLNRHLYLTDRPVCIGVGVVVVVVLWLAGQLFVSISSGLQSSVPASHYQLQTLTIHFRLSSSHSRPPKP